MSKVNKNEEETPFVKSLKGAWFSDREPGEDEVCDDLPLSRSPFLNDLIRVHRKMADGKAHKDEFNAQLQVFQKRLHTAKKQFLALYGAVEGTPPLKEVADKASRAFESYQEALFLMERSLESNDESLAGQGIELARESTERLFNAYEELGAFSRELSRKTCMKCGHESPLEARFCVSCKTEFPVLVPSVNTAKTNAVTDILTGRLSVPASFMNIYEGIEKFQKNELSGDELISRIEELRSIFQAAQPQVEHILTVQTEKISTPSPIKEEFLETGRTLTAGIDEALRGLEELIAFGATKNAATLASAWKMILQSGQQILAAQSRYGELSVVLGVEMANLHRKSGEQQGEIGTQEVVTISGED